ncbi:Oxidoreductase, short-chain dehydrogenase/reductase family [Liberibacter crescens BT-1]|uniref:Oxidoreductase, short-chain dehydrogenase/reductase family n=1 Tax=Liberibacter crescens (strain BT-1) TaxID=1215343 RepID=L0ETM9_LIBCB|nr:SDR family NAD(P)-dependent oxidoreductase [Liberibacter crescens]AGA64190.1 Oxidoreductase, short-chain dehydrogenase/reductase family [Liberibacter crescens BT-1]AMC12447.1 short-chain dehydrogenase [Liberibacter crescens]
MKLNSYKNEIIWIIGASSGIGYALAHELAKRNAILVLSARSSNDLENLKSVLGEKHKVFVLDVTDSVMTQRTAHAIYATFGRIDRVIFFAATYQPMKLYSLDLAVSRQIVEVNLLGALHVVKAVLSLPSVHKSIGQIALCGSVAGYAGLSGGQPYSATKAAIINLAESLYAELFDKIDIKLISPGFVRTRLTDQNDFTMPMIIKPEDAAKAIAQGLLSKAFEVHFPKHFTMLVKLLRFFPYRVYFWIIRQL